MASLSRGTEFISAFLLAAALALIQVLIGGTRLLFSLPSYGLLAVIALLSIFSLRRAKPHAPQICLASAALFFGYVLARAILSPVDYIARSDIYSVLGGLVLYFFVACIFTQAKRRMWVIFFLLTLALVHVLIGAIQFRNGNNFMLIPFLQRYNYERRASGFYVCPNHLAGLLEVLGIFALSMVCWSRWPTWAKLLIGYAAGVCYLGVALTGSRGGYLSAAMSLVVFGLLSLITLRQASARLFWSFGVVALIAAVSIGAASVFLIHKSPYLTNRTQNAFDTAPVRIDLWRAAVEEWKVQPWIGTGSGTYLYYGRMFRTPRMQQDPINVHNDYLHLLAEYGLIGGALFVLFLAAHLHAGWKNFQRLGPKRVAVAHNLLSNGLALYLGALAAVAAYMVHSFVDFNLHIPANVLLLAFVFGVLANPGTQREIEPAVSMSILAWRACLPVIGAILIVQCVRLLPGEYYAERARVAQRNNHPEEAIAFATRGLRTERANPSLYQYLASAELTQCDSLDATARAACYEKGIELFEKARELAPQDRTFLVPLAFTYDLVGRFAEAEWIYYEARRWDPRSTYLDESYKYHLIQWERNGGAIPPAASSEEAKPK
ncbi:MAG: hypothetical protein QOI04_1721 [Verrucomicrobiota bacterium]|jgi:O-antigen ligase